MDIAMLLPALGRVEEGHEIEVRQVSPEAMQCVLMDMPPPGCLGVDGKILGGVCVQQYSLLAAHLSGSPVDEAPPTFHPAHPAHCMELLPGHLQLLWHAGVAAQPPQVSLWRAGNRKCEIIVTLLCQLTTISAAFVRIWHLTSINGTLLQVDASILVCGRLGAGQSCECRPHAHCLGVHVCTHACTCPHVLQAKRASMFKQGYVYLAMLF